MEFDEDDNCVGGLVPKFGAIFMSNSATKKECLKHKIFGLPLAMTNFVKQVKCGMILFLFEFEKKELYGVFQAISDGTMNLKPRAFTSSGKQFPAQVQIAPIWSCRPLPEVVFRDAIKDNYYSPNKFHFGLSAQQVRALLQLFYSRRLNNRMPPRQIADKMSTREAGNERHKTDDSIIVTTTTEQENIDCTKSPYMSNFLETSFGRAERESDDVSFIGYKLEEGKANFNCGHGMGVNSHDLHWNKKRKINDDGRFPSRDASENEVLDNWPTWHATSADCGGDTFRIINSAADSTFLSNRGFSTEHVCNSLIGLVGADREPLMIEDRFKSVRDIGGSIEPDFIPVFPRNFSTSEDNVVADEYSCYKDDGVENACDVESFIRPDFSSGVRNMSKSFIQTSLVANDALNRIVPYDPEFPDLKYQCSTQIMNSAQDLSSHQVHDENLIPVLTSECVPHEAPSGSLYSEAPVVKASVFSRLSVAPRKHKKEDNIGTNDEDGSLALIDEIMDSLHQAHNFWLKGKPSVGAKSRHVYVRCKEETKFRNQVKFEQPVVKKEMTVDVDLLVEEDSDIVPKETRVVNFQRRSKMNKYLDEMASKFSAGTTMSMTSVDATGEDLAGKACKSRKLIRPDFRKKQSHEICDISDVTANNTRSTTSEDNTFLEGIVEGTLSTDPKKMCLASSIHQEALDGEELLQDIKIVNDTSQLLQSEMNDKTALVIENQVKLDLLSSLVSSPNTQNSPSVSTRVTGILGKFEGEKVDKLNSHVGSVANDYEQKSSLQNELGSENQPNLSIQDLVSSLASGSSAQEQQSFISGDIKIVNDTSQLLQSEMNDKTALVIENQVKLDLLSSLASSPNIQNSPSVSTEVTGILEKFEGEKVDEINSHIGSVANDCEQRSSLQNELESEIQPNLSIQDLVNSLVSSSSAQEQQSFISGVTAVPKNLEEETADINHQVGNGDIIPK